jgi:hypothetical protein
MKKTVYLPHQGHDAVTRQTRIMIRVGVLKAIRYAVPGRDFIRGLK